MFYDSCRKRFFDTSILDRFFALDQSWRDMLKEINDLKHEKNQLTEAISMGVKGKLDVESEKGRVKGLNVTISELEAKQKEISGRRIGWFPIRRRHDFRHGPSMSASTSRGETSVLTSTRNSAWPWLLGVLMTRSATSESPWAACSATQLGGRRRLRISTAASRISRSPFWVARTLPPCLSPAIVPS